MTQEVCHLSSRGVCVCFPIRLCSTPGREARYSRQFPLIPPFHSPHQFLTSPLLDRPLRWWAGPVGEGLDSSCLNPCQPSEESGFVRSLNFANRAPPEARRSYLLSICSHLPLQCVCRLDVCRLSGPPKVPLNWYCGQSKSQSALPGVSWI